MSSWDITRLTPEERTYEVANRFGGDSDLYALAVAGLDRIRQKEQHRRSVVRHNRSSKFVVEKTLVTTVNGRSVETRVYLSDQVISGSLCRPWGSPERVKVFKGERDAQRAWMNKGDPEARIIPHADMVGRADQFVSGVVA